MPDKQLKCCDCGLEFPFTEGEQKFYAEREYSDPKRCKPCRERRKAEKQVKEVNSAPPVAMMEEGMETERHWRGKKGRREH